MSGGGGGKRVAVIGSGISGLTVGWLLRKEFDVTVYDKTSSAGLDVHAWHVPPNDPKLHNSSTIHIDLPIRVHTPSYYTTFVLLLKELAVDTKDYHQDLTLCNSKGKVIISYSNVRFFGLSIPWMNLGSLGYCWEFVKFKWISNRYLQGEMLSDLTVDQYLKKIGLSDAFITDFLFNYLSLVCTCSYTTLRQYPAEPIVRFVCAISNGVSIRQFIYGTKDVSQRLEKELKTCYNASIEGIKLSEGKVLVYHNGKGDEYDHVIIATEPTVAHHLLKDIPELSERATALQKFSIEKSYVSVHSDESVLPFGSKSPKNTLVSKEDTSEYHTILKESYPSMKDLKVNLIQSWSTQCSVNPATIYKEATMNRVVLSMCSVPAAKTLQQLQGQHNVWICGAYADGQLPLLEGGVRSATRVARAFGVNPPWLTSVDLSTKSNWINRYYFGVFSLIILVLSFFLL